MVGREYNCVCVTLEPVYSLYPHYSGLPATQVRPGLHATTILFGRKHRLNMEVGLQTLLGLLCTAELIG
jgi:hypothetical protein